jgi:hypothetical protein
MADFKVAFASDKTTMPVQCRSGAQVSADFGETQTVNIGENGATFTPSVSEDGVLSWTNDKDLPNPEPVNIKGVKGDKGDKGDRGLQGIQGIQGERGEQGLKGDKGDTGATGPAGPKGDTGDTGPQGIQGPKGDKGDTGDTGPAYELTGADKQEIADTVRGGLGLSVVDGVLCVTYTE